MNRAFVALCALALVIAPASARAEWIASWGVASAPPQPAGPDAPPNRVAPAIADQTIVETVRLSAGGTAMRIRFSNVYSATPLEIGAARVSVVRTDGSVGPSAPVTFAGQTHVSVSAGALAFSDALPLKTAPLDHLRIAIYVQGHPTCTCHMTGLQPVELSPRGDFTDKPFASVAPATATYRAFLAGVDVEQTAKTDVVVALGDSVTDGVRSTMGADRRWSDRSAERIPGVGVVNAGLAANQLLSDGPPFGGQNALARLDRDGLSTPGVTHLILEEGINDIIIGDDKPPSLGALIAGYRQVVARAHARGVKVIAATLGPTGRGDFKLSPAGETLRQQVNAWIRTSGAFDAVVDFDAALRDPTSPDQIKENLRSIDGIHPNDAGYGVLADAVGVAILRLKAGG